MVHKMVYRNYIAGLVIFFVVTISVLIITSRLRGMVAELPTIEAVGNATNLVAPPAAVNVQEKIIPAISAVSDGNTFVPMVLRPTQTIFFVSKDGNNANGRTWATAWNELDQIRWKSIKPGDTIYIDGGVYHTMLDVGKSGTPGMPITITTNGEQVVMDGQLPQLPYCGQKGYVPKLGTNGIDMEGQSYIILDGLYWRGIVIKNFTRGIMMRENASHITVRNMEIHDNGYASVTDAGSFPNGPGVELGGSDILFEKMIIHDNGQDAFQAGWGVRRFTLRDSWLYNSREHSTEPGKSFNYCSHTDGIQIYEGGSQGPFMVENSIIGPSFTQGIIINNTSDVDNVVIRNTLFAGNDNVGVVIQNDGDSSNWTMENVTVVQDTVGESWNIKMNGNNHRILNSVFWGGPWGLAVYDWAEAKGNYHWQTDDMHNIASEADPMFVDNDFRKLQGEGFADFDFTIQNAAIPSGTGSKITTINELFYPSPDEPDSAALSRSYPSAKQEKYKGCQKRTK